jgi:ABC-type multidrug transport system ATPase subunit
MIDLTRLTAKSPPFRVTPITLRLGPGAHALLGRPEDGVGVLLSLVAGRVALRGGKGTVLDHPLGSRAAQRAVAYVPRVVSLPDALRVEETFAVAASIRGITPQTPAQRLEKLGLAHLARRLGRSLSPEEARSAALAEAISSGAPVVLVEEPLVGLEPRSAAALRDALVARARQPHTCVVASTSSVRDACEIADEVLVFDRGVLVRRSATSDSLALGVTVAARVRVVSSDPRALAAALAIEPAARALESEAEGAVVATGASLAEVASAIARAAVRARVDVQAIVPEAAGLDEVRAASAGDVAGAYWVAYERARARAQAQAQAQAAPPTVGGGA